MTASESGHTKAERTRASLREAAITAIARRGFHGTTTRDIAAAAQLSTTALYVYYSSKEELLFEIAKDGHLDTLRIVEAAVAASDEPVAQLRAFVFEFVTYHAREHRSAIIINREIAALDPQHYEEIMRLRQHIEGVLVGIFHRGVERAVFAIADVRLTMVSLLSLGLDVARWYRDTEPLRPEEIAAYYTTLALRIVGAKDPSI